MRVVIVDNDPDALDLLDLDLTLEGHEIVGSAMQGEEAIAVIEASAPDVVVLDFRMPPGIDGLEVARRLRRRTIDVRIVLYTNHVRADLLREAARLDVEYLRKGDLASLRRAVQAPA